MLIFLARLVTPAFFAIVPRRHRFAAAVRIARLGGPIAALAASRHLRLFNSGRSLLLWILNDAMNCSGIQFDIPIVVEGAEIIDGATGGGLLLVSGHSVLNALVIPWLRARGWRTRVLRAVVDKGYVVPGSGEPLPYFIRSPRVLVSIREALRAGEAVLISVDHPAPVSSGFSIATPRMTLYISDAAPRMAARWGARVAYLSTRLDAHARLRATIWPADTGLRNAFERWLDQAR
jgi:hypothetical protein